MGMDIHYQAMPENCELLVWARQEPNFGANLEFFESYATMSPEKLQQRLDNDQDPHFVKFVCQLRKLVEEHRGIGYRNLYFGRRWDSLYYLLSERRRKGEAQDWSHWVEKAIFGDQILNEATQTTIGFPIRYLYPKEVSDIQNKLETVTKEMLCFHWNPPAMSAVAVYKITADADRDALNWICEDFEKLKAFYTLIAGHDEGVLTFVS